MQVEEEGLISAPSEGTSLSVTGAYTYDIDLINMSIRFLRHQVNQNLEENKPH